MGEEKYIPLCVPCLTGNEKKYADECLDTSWISSVGHFVGDFEKRFAEYTGAEGAVAVMNGTAALHLSMIVAGIGAGDEIFAPSLTFIAPINAIMYTGARPVFVDTDRRTLGLCPEALEKYASESCEFSGGALVNKKTGRRIRAVLPVHLYGHSCDMGGIMRFAEKYNLIVIEDAAEAVGTLREGRHAGRDGLFGCFSFNGNKTLTTGGGGMVIGRDKKMLDHVRHLSTQAKKDELHYIHDEVGYNYRMLNIQAAIGLGQLEHVEEMIARKREIFGLYKRAFEGVGGLELFDEQPWCRSNCWFALAYLDASRRDEFMRRMDAKKIQTRPFWLPNHMQPMFKDCARGALPVVEELHSRGVSLPCGAHMSAADVDRVISATLEFFA